MKMFCFFTVSAAGNCINRFMRNPNVYKIPLVYFSGQADNKRKSLVYSKHLLEQNGDIIIIQSLCHYHYNIFIFHFFYHV